MGTVTNPVNTGNQATFIYDRSVVFIGDNTFENVEYKAPAAQVVLLDGQLMGKVAATGKLLELKSAAVDGSAIPYGILVGDHTIEIGETPTFSVCVSGDVATDKVVFDGADTMATVVDVRRLDDRILGDTLGVKLILATENSIADNV
tara:strand:- start:1603 stop:2043 length:441 start_codon:yes stop_codon:yes gene_type:complete